MIDSEDSPAVVDIKKTVTPEKTCLHYVQHRGVGEVAGLARLNPGIMERHYGL
jgi:hypothetical protein